MDITKEKYWDRSRSELFGLLLSCLFSDEVKNKCFLSQLRSSLTIEEKYNYVMKLKEAEIKKILARHAECLKRKLFATLPMQ